MSIRKSIIVFSSLLLVLTIWRMPASLVTRFLEANPQIPFNLSNTSGTLWDGNGRIKANAFRDASISWSVPILDILLFNPSVIWKMDSNNAVLKGKSSISGSNIITITSGTIGSSLLNRIFSEYDIILDGSLSIENLSVISDRNERFSINQLDGLLIWTGGEITYMLAKLPVTIVSPVFELELFKKTPNPIQARLKTSSYNFPVLLANLSERGNLNVKVTKAFTKIFGNEWPGADSEEQIVLELEEYIF